MKTHILSSMQLYGVNFSSIEMNRMSRENFVDGAWSGGSIDPPIEIAQPDVDCCCCWCGIASSAARTQTRARRPP